MHTPPNVTGLPVPPEPPPAVIHRSWTGIHAAAGHRRAHAPRRPGDHRGSPLPDEPPPLDWQAEELIPRGPL